MPFTTYGDTFRRRRKLMHQTLGPRTLSKYLSGLEAETKIFIDSLVTDPDNYVPHIRRYAGGLALSIVYGYNADSNDDKYLKLAEECMQLLSNDMAGSGFWPVDILPFLVYLPSWFPGGSFKTKAAEWKLRMSEFIEKPYSYAKECMVSGLWLRYNLAHLIIALCLQQAGTIHASFCATVFDDESSLSAETERDLKWTANSMYAGSAETVRISRSKYCKNPPN
jgi:hypothetical protein